MSNVDFVSNFGRACWLFQLLPTFLKSFCFAMALPSIALIIPRFKTIISSSMYKRTMIKHVPFSVSYKKYCFASLMQTHAFVYMFVSFLCSRVFSIHAISKIPQDTLSLNLDPSRSLKCYDSDLYGGRIRCPDEG